MSAHILNSKIKQVESEEELYRLALVMISNGATHKEIGAAVHRSYRTIDKWVENMKNEFECKNTAHLIATVIRLKIIE